MQKINQLQYIEFTLSKQTCNVKHFFIFFLIVNTPGAEVLYEQIAEWCGVSKTTTVLDICCGTGTIGLTIAKVSMLLL